MCNNLIDLYTDYLISSFSKTTATGLSSIVDGCLSHDQITTFLAESNLDSKSLWLKVKPMVRELEKAKGTGVLIFAQYYRQKLKHRFLWLFQVLEPSVLLLTTNFLNLNLILLRMW